jgi:hemoglobin/transferrin/lactoferrin receptor protein
VNVELKTTEGRLSGVPGDIVHSPLLTMPWHDCFDRARMKWVLAFVLYSSAASAIAQNLLDPLVVTAGRMEQPESRTAYSIEVMDARFIADSQRRTLPEVLQYTPGVLVQKTAHGHGSPFIRGFTGRQNLLLVDGVRMNNSTWRSGPVQYWNTVDPLSIDHIELIRSQGSVLYGSDAVGGTLNAFTKSAGFEDEAEGELFHRGSAYYEYRSNGEGSHIGRVESAFGKGGQWGVHLGLSGKDFGDIEDDAVGRMNHTGYPEQDLDFRFDMVISERINLTLAHQFVNQDDVWRWHRTIYNPGWVHDDHVATGGRFLTEIHDQERSLTYLKLTGENPEQSSFVRRWHTTLSWQKTQDSIDNLRTKTDRRTNSIDLDTYGLDVGFESEIGPGTMVYGLDYYQDEVDSAAFRNGTVRPDDRPVADGSTYQLLGSYAQYEWRPVEPVKVVGGARYTYAEAEWDAYRAPGAKEDISGGGDWDDFSASLRALWDINDCWALYGGVSQAFRAPNLNDLTGNTVSRGGEQGLGSPEVEPEKYLTAELGTRYGNETVSGSLAAFYTWSRDAIIAEPGPLPNTTLATNGGSGFVYGFEAEGIWNITPCWMLSAMAGWNEGKSDSPTTGERWISRQLPLTGSLALRWTHPNGRLWLEGRVFGAVTEDRVDPADQASDPQRLPINGTPGYLVSSLRAGWQVNEHLDLTLGVENLTDEDYRNHGSGQNEPGLGGIFAAKVSW